MSKAGDIAFFAFNTFMIAIPAYIIAFLFSIPMMTVGLDTDALIFFTVFLAPPLVSTAIYAFLTLMGKEVRGKFYFCLSFLPILPFLLIAGSWAYLQFVQ